MPHSSAQGKRLCGENGNQWPTITLAKQYRE
jgi:hypothetical protein